MLVSSGLKDTHTQQIPPSERKSRIFLIEERGLRLRRYPKQKKKQVCKLSQNRSVNQYDVDTILKLYDFERGNKVRHGVRIVKSPATSFQKSMRSHSSIWVIYIPPSKGHEQRNKFRKTGDQAQRSLPTANSLFFTFSSFSFLWGLKGAFFFFDWRKRKPKVN